MQGVEPGVRNKSSVAVKNACRAALKDNARLLASIINGQASVTDAMKLDLGLTVRATPTPIPPPSIAPKIDIVSMIANALTVRLHDGTGSRRGRPPLVQGCSIFSFVGNTPPNTVDAWKFEGSSSEMVAKIVFDPTLTPGTKVWVTAFFCNAKLQSGPAAEPVSTQIQFSPLSEAV